MLFSLKKFVSIFLMPISIGLILFLVGLYFFFNKRYKRAKLFLSISFIWFFIIGYSPVSNNMIQPLEQQYKSYLDVDKNIKYVLVLGHSHVTNKNLSTISQLSSTAIMRLSEAIRIYRELNDAKLIVSGYAGEDIKTPHAFILRDAAISLGVPKENIITLESAKDTKEEATFVKDVVQYNRFVLVTSAFHMPRAIKIFNNAWLNPVPAPTNFLSKEDGDFSREPRGKEIRKTELAMHEYIGTLWHFLVQKYNSLIN